MKTIIAAGAAALALATAAAPAPAGTLFGGSTLVDADRQAQLERWLGAGELNLTTVYTLRPGDDSSDFHAGADGQGPTFTLLDVTNAAGASYLVGGYNPQGWASNEGWHETPRDFQRTAFLFNFTDPAVYRQVLSTYVLPSQGQRQTYNELGFGPVFGSGPDLFVNDRMDAALSWQLSYGDPNDESLSIIDRSARGQLVSVDAMEVFAISPVPEPGQAALLLAGLGVAGLFARKRRREAR